MIFYDFPYLGKNNIIFFRGLETTNQICMCYMCHGQKLVCVRTRFGDGHALIGTDIPSKDSIIGIPSNYFIYSISMGITINFMITHPTRELTMTQSLTLTQTINHKNNLWPSLTMAHMLCCNIYLTNMPSCLLVKQRFGLVKPYFLDSCAFSSFEFIKLHWSVFKFLCIFHTSAFSKANKANLPRFFFSDFFHEHHPRSPMDLGIHLRGHLFQPLRDFATGGQAERAVDGVCWLGPWCWRIWQPKIRLNMSQVSHQTVPDANHGAGIFTYIYLQNWLILGV